ncbi:hypothetical protein HanHA300_Chr04g0156721 [Helianthus annuus]|uniref:uncharacterized protein LOC118491246 isoform X1 n=1 Tax=Helianthus annuus TaxID=4232 RepID=UPI001652C388|nr:uncharacterized protein LOC118491246 isoform X1 [Helianthus annuus]KAJ0582860.1 hypothetical protein HanHA300_Chr04g0156721 [Helianthus annuus]KAJ0598852.1 hypothetical protein HanHA89_Chr04g0170251 [Helianthus annuus]
MLAVELSPANNHRHSASPQASLFCTSALAVGEILEKSSLEDSVSCVSKDQIPKIDKSGRFCNPRAARELALNPSREKEKERGVMGGGGVMTVVKGCGGERGLWLSRWR